MQILLSIWELTLHAPSGSCIPNRTIAGKAQNYLYGRVGQLGSPPLGKRERLLKAYWPAYGQPGGAGRSGANNDGHAHYVPLRVEKLRHSLPQHYLLSTQ